MGGFQERDADDDEGGEAMEMGATAAELALHFIHGAEEGPELGPWADAAMGLYDIGTGDAAGAAKHAGMLAVDVLAPEVAIAFKAAGFLCDLLPGGGHGGIMELAKNLEPQVANVEIKGTEDVTTSYQSAAHEEPYPESWNKATTPAERKTHGRHKVAEARRKISEPYSD